MLHHKEVFPFQSRNSWASRSVADPNPDPDPPDPHVFGPEPDPLVRGMDPNQQKSKKNLESYCFVTSF